MTVSTKLFKRVPTLHVGGPTVTFGCSFAPPVLGTGVLTGSTDVFHGCSGSMIATNSYEIYPHQSVVGFASGTLLNVDVQLVHSSSTPGYQAFITSATFTKIAFMVQSSGSLGTTVPDRIMVTGEALFPVAR